MPASANTIGYFFTHPEAIIYGVASALLYPVLFIELAALVYATAELGRFSVEMYKRRKARAGLDIEQVAQTVRKQVAQQDTSAASQFLTALEVSPVAKAVLGTLRQGEAITRSRILKALADAELEMSRILERTRMLIRIGPMLGLMGTLIPISPALVALAQGNVQELSNKLVVAFSTTVVGLLIGAIGYVITTVRDRHYQRDIVDVEYVLDQMKG